MSILVDENTTFIIQGITGREAVNMTRPSPAHPELVEGRLEDRPANHQPRATDH